jgi:hypothetical protein
MPAVDPALMPPDKADPIASDRKRRQRLPSLLYFGSPLFTAAMTASLAVAATYFLPGPTPAMKTTFWSLLCLNAALAAAGSGYSGLLTPAPLPRRILRAVYRAAAGLALHAALATIAVTVLTLVGLVH